MQRGLLLADTIFEKMRHAVSLERALVIGAALAASGAAGIVVALGYWRNFGFGRIDFGGFENDTALRLVCGGSTGLMLGVQIIYGAFFLYLLDYQAITGNLELPINAQELQFASSGGSPS